MWYQPFYRCREALCNCPNLKRLHMIGDVPDDFDLENFQRTLKAGSSAKELSWDHHPKIGVYITRNTSTRKSEELNLRIENQSFELKQLYSQNSVFKGKPANQLSFHMRKVAAGSLGWWAGSVCELPTWPEDCHTQLRESMKKSMF